MNRRLIVTACVILMAFGGITVMAGEGSLTGTLSGCIRDAETGAGLSGATLTVPVALLTCTTTTDENGNFTIDGMPPGINYTVNVTIKGYKSAAFYASISTNETSRCNVNLYSTYLKLLCPNGGESIFAGSEVVILWESVGISRIRLEFSINDGRTWILIADEIDAPGGTYLWDVPDIPSSEYRIRILDTGEKGLMDVSDDTFQNSSI